MSDRRIISEDAGEDIEFIDERIDAYALLKWISETLKDVPAQHRDTAYVSARCSAGWGTDEGLCDVESMSMHYLRSETDAELAHRLEQDRQYRELYEAQERAQYEALKRKFG